MEDISYIARMFPIGAIKNVHMLDTGIIHATYKIDAEEGFFILQRMNPIFGETVLEDIEEVTRHLAKKHFPTFTLVRTKNGSLSYQEGDYRWRMLTFISGHICTAPTVAQLKSAGMLVGMFHTALSDYHIPFKHTLSGFHDTEGYMKKLTALHDSKQASAKYAVLAPLTQKIISAYRILPKEQYAPMRVLHGDLKMENLLFNEKEEACALIDFDTMGRYSLAIELGDMLRSGTKIKTQEGSLAFSLKAYDAMLEGYRMRATFVTEEEWRAIPHGLMRITLELAARYVIDAYEETYFAHRADMFHSLFEQNTSKAKDTLSFFESFITQMSVIV